MMKPLHYLVRKPKKEIVNPPLLILLHGYGSNEHDLFSFADELPDEFLIISAQAPLSMGFGGYAWYSINFDDMNGKFSDLDEAKQSIEIIAHFVDEMQEKYQTQQGKTFVLGFSQGAILSYAVSFLHPNKINYVVALSGYINTELLPKVFPTQITTKYYASHGSVDQVLPVEWARKTKPFLEKNELKVVYFEYPVGHGVSPQNFYSLKAWIQSNLD